jgi:hypothetical protein
MTRTPFDQFAKQFFEAFLTPLGEVTIQKQVPGEPMFVDIWFAPSPQPDATPKEIGIFQRMAATCCLIEPFRNQPSSEEVRSCLQKLFHVRSDSQRQSEENIPDQELPRLWIVASSISQNVLNEFGGTSVENWLNGMYFLVAGLKTAVINVKELPQTPETMWLRLLGKGKVQQQAIDELITMRKDDPKRLVILKLLATWRISIKVSAEIDLEDRELMMTLSKAYLEWEKETELRGMERGMERGIQEGQRILLENLLRARYGVLDAQLTAIVQPILDLSPQEYTSLLLQLSNLEREDLCGRFQ